MHAGVLAGGVWCVGLRIGAPGVGTRPALGRALPVPPAPCLPGQGVEAALLSLEQGGSGSHGRLTAGGGGRRQQQRCQQQRRPTSGGQRTSAPAAGGEGLGHPPGVCGPSTIATGFLRRQRELLRGRRKRLSHELLARIQVRAVPG